MNDYELYHASTRKHKYIKKIGNRYFYTQQEIAAYLQGKKPKDLTVEKDDYGDEKGYHLDFNKEQGKYQYKDSKGKVHTNTYTMSDKIGVSYDKKNKNLKLYNTTNKKFYKNDEKLIRKSKGRVATEYAEDGVRRQIDLSKDKHNMKKENERWKKAQEFGAEADSPEEYRKKRRKKAVKAAKKTASKNLKSLKKQAARGKKKLDKIYTKATTPSVTVTYDEAKIK